MATRRTPIPIEHVNAINLIEVDFFGCEDVIVAWRAYSLHLNDQSEIEDQNWQEEKEKLLAKTLSEIAKVLGFKMPAIEIFKGGYAPKGWVHRDQRQLVALEYVSDLYEGKRVIPVVVLPTPTGSATTIDRKSAQD